VFDWFLFIFSKVFDLISLQRWVQQRTIHSKWVEISRFLIQLQSFHCSKIFPSCGINSRSISQNPQPHANSNYDVILPMNSTKLHFRSAMKRASVARCEKKSKKFSAHLSKTPLKFSLGSMLCFVSWSTFCYCSILQQLELCLWSGVLVVIIINPHVFQA
jgi:hypothetical protein